MHTPSAYIPMDRRQAMARGESLPERSSGSALFADISGFTPLTEALVRALGPRRGAEELLRWLNEVYDTLISEVDRRSGSVIGFAGDSITCWFDGDPGLRAAACGLAMQEALRRFASVSIVPGETVALAAKVAIAYGDVRRFVVGDPEIQLIDVLAGATLEHMAATEHITAKGEVVLDESSVLQIRDAVEVSTWRIDPERGRQCAVIRALRQPVPDARWPLISSDSLPDSLTRSWLLPPVYERVSSGHGAFQAELRPTVALFVGFSGIDYDGDAAAPQLLDDYVRWVQHVLDRYGGSLIQVTIGDKGSYLYVAFGAPVARGDEAIRAVAAALDIQALPPSLSYLGRPRIGIATGRSYCGPSGGATRRTYAVMGDGVNVAARLMQAAPIGDILTSELIERSARRSFRWEKLEPIRLKGKSEPLSVFRPFTSVGRHSPRLQEPQHTLPFVGREDELRQIQRAAEKALRGKGQIVAISAEAGMGKSRLVAETIRLWSEHRLDVYVGECQPYGTHDSYLVWQNIWRSFFGIQDLDQWDEQIRVLEAKLYAIDPALVPRLPLLGVALNLAIPDNDLTRSLDAKLRKSSLEALLVDCLQVRTRSAPVLLVLEDCHWMDPLSHDLLESIARIAGELPVLLELAYRPPELQRLQLPRVTELPWSTLIELNSFNAVEAERLIALKLARLTGDAGAPSSTLVRRVADRAQGNPFYIEELLNYLHDCGIDPGDAKAVANLDLPTSLHTLLLSRIDQLSESQKITIKTASVIGRQFHMAWLWGAHPQIGTGTQVQSDLDILSDLDLTPLDQPEPERVYLFKHIVTREVAYDSLPYATRALLHGQLGEYIERTYAEILDQYVDLLAYHFDLSEIASKKCEYLRRAGEAAQSMYANEAAIDYYRRLLPLLSGPELISILVKLGQVLELVGEWDEASDHYNQALRLAELEGDLAGQGPARRAMGWLLRKRGEYREAVSWLDEARRLFERLGDLAAVSQVMTDMGEVCRQLGAFGEAKGWYDNALRLVESIHERKSRLTAQAQALKGYGTLAAQQGDNAAARRLYEESLKLRRELGDRPGVAVLLNNLGIVSYWSGDLESARNLDKESLAVFREVGDRWSAGQLLNNLGDIAREQADYATARRLVSDSLEVRRQLGDKSGLALSLNSLADVLLDEGDYVAARPLLAESLTISWELGDRMAVAYLLNDFSAVAAIEGLAVQSLVLSGAATAAYEELGAQLSAGEQGRFLRLQAPAREALSEDEADHARQSGRAMSFEQAIAYALETKAPRQVALAQS